MIIDTLTEQQDTVRKLPGFYFNSSSNIHKHAVIPLHVHTYIANVNSIGRSRSSDTIIDKYCTNT